MKINSFIATTSWLLYGRLIFTIVFCFILIMTVLWGLEIRIENELLFLLLFLTVFLLTYRLLRKIALIEAKLYSENKSEFIFVTKYFLLKQKNKIFSFEQVRDYTYENGNGYNIFRIRFKKGRDIKLLIDIDENNLKKFLSSYDDFKKNIKTYNNKNSENKISARLPVYQRKIGLYYAIIIFLLMIILPILYLFSDSQINWLLFLFFYPPAIIYLYNFISAKNK
ncbi:MAG: hypothetical protein JNM71_10595 [Flavobacterium lindanitolerans]|uniref:hypothetical protein n=1 Tax=Flavobacterium lindanitolerans TaxID=428988 RepID=UPI001A5D4862|nr:hypothetical protein [Flavobacterium lindanitolerans]MBL7868457.1 hypothetical protein [Flavobacterium lindanitolerans]